MKKKLKWRAGSGVRAALSRLARSRGGIDRAGKLLLKSCNGSIFPGDVYFIGTCNRALQNVDAFLMAMTADYYSTTMILLRVQLDSVLRCYGLILTGDPHGAADEIMQGSKKLSEFKDKAGNRLKDSYLVESFSGLSPSNSIVKHIYDLSSGYVHLSDSAMSHVLAKTKKMSNGEQGFYVYSAEPEVSSLAKTEVIQSFRRTTNAFIDLVEHWAGSRADFGDVANLIARFDPQTQASP